MLGHLEPIIKATQADELMVTTMIYDHRGAQTLLRADGRGVWNQARRLKQRAPAQGRGSLSTLRNRRSAVTSAARWSVSTCGSAFGGVAWYCTALEACCTGASIAPVCCGVMIGGLIAASLVQTILEQHAAVRGVLLAQAGARALGGHDRTRDRVTHRTHTGVPNRAVITDVPVRVPVRAMMTDVATAAMATGMPPP